MGAVVFNFFFLYFVAVSQALKFIWKSEQQENLSFNWMVLINGLRWSNTTGCHDIEREAYMLLCNIFYRKAYLLETKVICCSFFFFVTVTNYPRENGVFPASFIYKRIRKYVEWQEAKNCRCSQGVGCSSFAHHLVPGDVQPPARTSLSYAELHRINIYHIFSDTLNMNLSPEWKY